MNSASFPSDPKTSVPTVWQSQPTSKKRALASFPKVPLPGQNHRTDASPVRNGEKRRFKILNELERKGLAQKQKELEKRCQNAPSPELNYMLEKAKLMELESCYQIKSDRLEKSALQLKQSEEARRQLEKNVQFQKNKIAHLETDLEESKSRRRRVESSLDSLERRYDEKKRKLGAAEEDISRMQSDHDDRCAEWQQAIQDSECKYDEMEAKYAEARLHLHEKETECERLSAASLEMKELLNQERERSKQLMENVQGLFQQISAFQEMIQQQKSQFGSLTADPK